jgi:hypothetical protein
MEPGKQSDIEQAIRERPDIIVGLCFKLIKEAREIQV